MKLSQRTAHDDVPNRLSAAVAAAGSLLDLTLGNPTLADLPYDGHAILSALADPAALVYAPEPLGLVNAREIIAADWTARGTPIDASRVALTASTSEAYGVLFKILCDPGDEILVPSPSYPLLGYLAAFESVVLKPYPLVYAGGWHVDVPALRAAVTPRTKAIVVISPNNPTGSYLGAGELEAMLDLELPIISDEVFATYPLGPLPEGRLTSVIGATRGLVFALSGLSKLAALPQLKLGWIGMAGAPDHVAMARARLELVLDSYLSVSTPVQVALAAILAAKEVTVNRIRQRALQNLHSLRRQLADTSATVLEVEGGWYAIIRVPETMTDEEWALALLERQVHVQPGYFFDMDRGAHLVVSLLTPEVEFSDGMTILKGML